MEKGIYWEIGKRSCWSASEILKEIGRPCAADKSYWLKGDPFAAIWCFCRYSPSRDSDCR